jgi:hypothetical protein
VVSQRSLGEVDTEALLGVGGVRDVASVDVVPPSLLRHRLQAHMTHARARHHSQPPSVVPSLSSSPSWQSLSGQILGLKLHMERVTQPHPLAVHHEDDDDDDDSDDDDCVHKEKQSSGDGTNTSPDGESPHLSVVERVLLQLDKQGHDVLISLLLSSSLIHSPKRA